READLVTILGAFRPIQHAPCDVKCFPAFSEVAALLLSELTCAPMDSRVDGPPFHVPVECLCFQRCPLVGSELELSDPATDRGQRRTDLFGDRLHRHPVLPS